MATGALIVKFVLLMSAVVGGVRAQPGLNRPIVPPRPLQYVPFTLQLVLTQTPLTTNLASLTFGSSFTFNDIITSTANSTQPLAGRLAGSAFFTQGLDLTANPPAAVIQIVATVISAANPADSFAFIGPSNSLTNVTTDVAVVGGTGIFSGATGAGRIRVTQFIPTDTTLLRLNFSFFALATPLPVPAP
ncbi:hypothetical protein KFL_002730030 [Klebsormidium nitens]|uniref:Dirigent protein n=1 Tax=Klebsormidium nitens TaxID=105231 RepID=A0A1Y1I5B8_KLENI|nr:hypothetical protein KFL_002730030 [Klebsormidium nitens]|eukprot:GAQ86145.1 hypothetical protein KFL_002730030 [Klebsormidium nitens]